MPNFKYRALNQEGKTVESVILAADQKVVIKQLEKLNMTPIAIERYEEKNKKRKAAGKVELRQVLLFTKQLRTLLKAGIPIVTCLNVIKEQTDDQNFATVLAGISRDIEGGSKLSDALSEFPKVFPELYVNSIRVGEISGTLEDTLEQLSGFMEEDARIKKEVKKALRYPLIVGAGLLAAFIVFTTFVIPNFIPIFEMSGQELPLPTKILMGFYYLITNWGILLLVLLGAAAAGLWSYIKTPAGRYQADLLQLQVPVMGVLVRKLNISRFAKLLHTMNKTGISIVKSFEIIEETLDNTVYRKEVKTVRDKVIKGDSLAESIKQSPYFDKLLVIMVSIGEKSGSLDEMLANVSEFYYREVSDTVENLTSMIEPVVTVVLGTMMLFLALAIFLPMWDMMSAF